MKFLTNRHKSALFVIFLLFVGAVHAQTSQSRSGSWYKREAFKDVDHFYLGGHIGLALPFGYYERGNSTLVGVIIPSHAGAPQHRLFVGYKRKVHYFEVSVESKIFMPYYSYDPFGSKASYLSSRMGYYLSGCYSIDLMPRSYSFKINIGSSLGGYFPQYTQPIGAMGLNLMFEVPCTKNVSFYSDFRFMIGFSRIDGQIDSYYGKVYTRVMGLDMNLGFRINMFTKSKREEGWGKYADLKAH